MHAPDSSKRVADLGVGRALPEQAIVFACGDDELIGILAAAETPRRRGVIVVVGGPQYRAGSHRQFTLLARQLAAAGYPTFRFDYRGMGDSEGMPREFDTIDADIRAAIAAFRQAMPILEEIVLWALCDGASATLMFGEKPEGIAGMVVLNPWISSSATRARAHVKLYYPQRLMQRQFWSKLVSGDFDAREAIRSLWSNLRQSRSESAGETAAFMVRMRTGLANFGGRTLLVLSGNDLVAKELLELAAMDAEWRRALASPRVRQIVIPDADHTFSRGPWAEAVERHTLAWLGSW